MRMAAAALCVLFSLAAPAAARHALTMPAPEFPVDAAWINAVPFTLSQLRNRRVVLVAFINSANINSLRALKALKTWDEAWSLEGLMVIGVHTPTFAFQKQASEVEKALRFYGIEFPVVMDNNKVIWNAYANEGWPAFYLIDGEGRIVYDHLGEDRYGEIESEIRRALGELQDYSRPEGPPLVKNAVVTGCGAATPEVSLATGAPPPEKSGQEQPLDLTLSSREGEAHRIGDWYQSIDGPELGQANPELSASISVFYRGAQALASLSPGPHSNARFYIRQDRLWLHSLNAGADVRFDADGRSYVVVNANRLYELTANASDDPHELEVAPAARGTGVRGFSFSNRCLRVER